MAANEARFKLRDLLALPMQRVLKYHLFLKVCLSVVEIFRNLRGSGSLILKVAQQRSGRHSPAQKC